MLTNLLSRSFTAIGLAASFAFLCAAGCGGRVSSGPAPDLTLAKAIREQIEEGAGGGGAAVAAADPTGWATLSGTFTLTGSAPGKSVAPVTKDHAVCKPGDQTVYENDIVVGPNGELANVLVYLVNKIPDDPKWINESYDATKTAQLIYDQKNCVFLNRVFAMRASQTVKILNSDPVEHNTKTDPNEAEKINTIIPPTGVVYAPLRQEASPFAVGCTIHPWMRAWMISRSNPYFAITDSAGKFEIKQLPAGVPLEFRVWHERAKGQSLESVSLDGKDIKWPKGRYKLKLEDGKDVQINVAVAGDLLK